jgi:hypothetical protein
LNIILRARHARSVSKEPILRCNSRVCVALCWAIAWMCVGGWVQLNLTSVDCECNSSGMMTIQQGEVLVQVGCSDGAQLVQRKCKVLVRCVTHKRHIHIYIVQIISLGGVTRGWRKLSNHAPRQECNPSSIYKVYTVCIINVMKKSR